MDHLISKEEARQRGFCTNKCNKGDRQGNCHALHLPSLQGEIPKYACIVSRNIRKRWDDELKGKYVFQKGGKGGGFA